MSARLSPCVVAIVRWLRHKHHRLGWNDIRHRFCDRDWRIAHNGIVFVGAFSVAVTRYRCHGRNTPRPATVSSCRSRGPDMWKARSGGVIRIRSGGPRAATLSTASIHYMRDGSRRVHIPRVPHDGAIDVTITLNYRHPEPRMTPVGATRRYAASRPPPARLCASELDAGGDRQVVAAGGGQGPGADGGRRAGHDMVDPGDGEGDGPAEVEAVPRRDQA
jgi:hypothetical protein